MNIPRHEHPDPQWQRDHWKNLNGEWEFDFDFGVSARERGLYEGGALSRTITVPFCPESVLSGIGYTDFIPSVCYRRTFALTEQEFIFYCPQCTAAPAVEGVLELRIPRTQA